MCSCEIMGSKVQEMENIAQNCRGGKCKKGKCSTRLQGLKISEKRHVSEAMFVCKIEMLCAICMHTSQYLEH